MPNNTCLILGSGMTADAAVHGIRDVDRSGSIGLLSAETHPPYHRPPLSKGQRALERQTPEEPYRQGVVSYLRDGRVRRVLLWNVGAQVDAARKLIAEPEPFRPESLQGRLPA